MRKIILNTDKGADLKQMGMNTAIIIHNKIISWDI